MLRVNLRHKYPQTIIKLQLWGLCWPLVAVRRNYNNSFTWSLSGSNHVFCSYKMSLNSSWLEWSASNWILFSEVVWLTEILIEQSSTIVNIRSPSYFYMNRSIRAHTVMSQQEERLKQEAEGDPLKKNSSQRSKVVRSAMWSFLAENVLSFNTQGFFFLKIKALSSPFVSLSFISKMYVFPQYVFLKVLKCLIWVDIKSFN